MKILSQHVFAAAVMLAIFSAGACGDMDETDDEEHDAFLADGKADAAIAEGSPDARGILKLVNTASGQTFARIGITSRATSSISKRRNGPDLQWRTADDRTIMTLAELDALSWVGTVTFRKLLTYARAYGYVDGAMISGVIETTYIGVINNPDTSFPLGPQCIIWVREDTLGGLLGLIDSSGCESASFFASRHGDEVSIPSGAIKRMTDTRTYNELWTFQTEYLPEIEYVHYYNVLVKLPGVAP